MSISLYNLCKKKLRETYVVDFEKLKGILPKIIYDELNLEWLTCDEVLELSDDENDRVYEILSNSELFNLDNMWEDPSHLVKRCVVALTPTKYEEYPEFSYINSRKYNHIYVEYYMEIRPHVKTLSLCEWCFSCVSNYWLDFSADLWQRDNVRYSIARENICMFGDEVFSRVLKDKDYWCDRCKICPLFKIDSESSCRNPMDYIDCGDFVIHDITGRSNIERFLSIGMYF